jgi:hypothetical protein
MQRVGRENKIPTRRLKLAPYEPASRLKLLIRLDYAFGVSPCAHSQATPLCDAGWGTRGHK